MEETEAKSEVIDEFSTLDVFDWESGEYTDAAKRESLFGIDRVFLLSATLLLSICSLFGAHLLQKYNKTQYSLSTESFPIETDRVLESCRWMYFIGGSTLAFSSTLLLIHFTPFMVYFFYKRVNSREVPSTFMALYGHVFAAEWEFGVAVLVLVAANLAGYLFPLPAVTDGLVGMDKFNDQELMIKVLKEAESGDPTVRDTKTMEAIRLWLKANTKSEDNPTRTADILDASTHIVSIVKNLTGMSWQLRLIRLTYLLAVHWTIKLVFTLSMSVTAVAFHKRTLQSRLSVNKQALMITKRLRDRLLSSTIHGKSSRPNHGELGAALFDKLCPRGQEFVKLSELREFLPQDQASLYMDLIDLDGNGDISREEFIVAVKRFFKERHYLECSQVGNVKIIRQLSNFLHSVGWTATILTLLVLVDETITDTLKMVGGALLSFTFIFGGTAADAFQSVIFILVSHPFDVGDKVLIDNQSFKVKELGLWTCSFENHQDAIVYLCNNEIREAKIANTRRSGRQTESCRLKLNSSCNDRQLEQLEVEMRRFVEENERDFEVGSFMITRVTVMDRERIEVEMEVTHKSNFQETAVRNRRSRAFFLALTDALSKCNISIADPPG